MHRSILHRIFLKINLTIHYWFFTIASFDYFNFHLLFFLFPRNTFAFIAVKSHSNATTAANVFPIRARIRVT